MIPTVSVVLGATHGPKEIHVRDQGPANLKLLALALWIRRSQLETKVPLIWPVRLRPQPRWIWIRREAASADGFGIRISRTPSLYVAEITSGDVPAGSLT